MNKKITKKNERKTDEIFLLIAVETRKMASHGRDFFFYIQFQNFLGASDCCSRRSSFNEKSLFFLFFFPATLRQFNQNYLLKKFVFKTIQAAYRSAQVFLKDFLISCYVFMLLLWCASLLLQSWNIVKRKKPLSYFVANDGSYVADDITDDEIFVVNKTRQTNWHRHCSPLMKFTIQYNSVGTPSP